MAKYSDTAKKYKEGQDKKLLSKKAPEGFKKKKESKMEGIGLKDGMKYLVRRQVKNTSVEKDKAKRAKTGKVKATGVIAEAVECGAQVAVNVEGVDEQKMGLELVGLFGDC